MERPVITALADLLRGHVDLSKPRLETMALLTVGMIGARTVNLVHVALVLLHILPFYQPKREVDVLKVYRNWIGANFYWPHWQ